MTDKPKNLRQLIEQGYLFPAWLPDKNDFLLSEEGKKARESIDETDDLPTDVSLLDLDNIKQIEGYLAFLTKKDYGALSPLMWNSLFERLGLNYKAIYFVGNPDNAEIVVNAFKSDPKYVGGGFGSGWKEQFQFLDGTEPQTLKSVNFIARDAESDGLVGYNTDIRGLLLPLEKEFEKLGKQRLKGKTILVFGAGGVGKELPGHLVKEDVSQLYLLNRTVEKVEKLANEANEIREGVAVYAGENEIEKYLLNPEVDAAINVTKKGAEPLQDYAAFASVDLDEGAEENNTQSLELAEKLAITNPDIVIYDITLPKSGKPKTLEIAEKAGLKHLVRGTGMVVNQGIIAAEKLHEKNPGVFGERYNRDTIKQVFNEVTQ